MSLQVNGTLAVREIRGRNGRFKVGSLITEIGEFSLKTPLLEQYDEGAYEGSFELVRIFPRQYIVGNRVTLEVAAQIGHIWLKDAVPGEVLPAPETEPEPDDDAPVPAPAISPEVVVAPTTTESEEVSPAEPDLLALFGEDLLPLGPVVKLDPTVGRPRLKQQTQVLKSRGYVFDSKAMVWTQTQ